MGKQDAEIIANAILSVSSEKNRQKQVAQNLHFTESVLSTRVNFLGFKLKSL